MAESHTAHSPRSEGLEWPVVFIPACEQGTYPSYRCTEPAEIAEERRLLYVAMTRAQTFLVRPHREAELETTDSSTEHVVVPVPYDGRRRQ